MAVIFCVECGTYYSEYGEKCIKCGCPAEISKNYYDALEDALMQKKIAVQKEVSLLDANAEEAKKLYQLCLEKEDEAAEKYSDLIDAEEKKLDEEIKVYENEKETNLEKLRDIEMEIQKRLSQYRIELNNTQMKINNCGFFKRKEKEMLAGQLEEIRAKYSAVKVELENCKKEMEAILQANISVQKISGEKHTEKINEIEKRLVEEYCQIALDLYADNSLVEAVRKKAEEGFERPVSQAVEQLYYSDKYNYVIPKSKVKDEVISIIASLKFTSLEKIIQYSALLACLDAREVQQLFSNLQHTFYIRHIECDLDHSFYYTSISEAERVTLVEAEKNRMHLENEKQELMHQIRVEINRLTQEAIASSKRGMSNPARASIELQLTRNLTDKINELSKKLEIIEKTGFSEQIKTTDIGKELDLATLQVALENSNIKPKSKDASVIGRAVAGAAVAGPVGAVVGAVSAVDKNIRNKE